MADKKKQKTLIVDDEAVNIISLAKILRQSYDVIVAADGHTAIETAKKHIPDVILLDIVMPDMNGFDVLVNLKNSDLTKDVPVIFITGLDSTQDEEKGFALGAVDYITKPFHESIVKARVRTHLRMAGYIRTIERLSMVDTLTELPNRRNFDSRMAAEWGRAAREKKPVGFLMIDVDHFKRYNDTYGHPQGDLLLQAISGAIRQALKRSVDYVARWGGEEFAVLLPDTDLRGALYVAERIRKNVEDTRVLCSNGTKTSITVSIGVNTLTPKLGDKLDDFISMADKALYSAKNNGRNRVCSS